MIPKGDTPQKAREFYDYLNGHQQTTHPVATWHISWFSLAWMWGFTVILLFTILLWVKQYRTTRQRTGIYPIDSFGGWTSEAAGPATIFFLLFVAVIVAFAVAIIVGHIVWGQKF